MKPRHTAEQSTIQVNKAAKMGKVGFAAVALNMTTAEAPQPVGFAAPLQKVLVPDISVPALTDTKETETMAQTPSTVTTSMPVVEEKKYTVHLPEDPGADNLCIGCE